MNFTTPSMRRVVAAIAILSSFFFASACTNSDKPASSPPSPVAKSTPSAPTDTAADESSYLASLTTTLKSNGWPVVGQVSSASPSAVPYRVEVQFPGCGKATLAVVLEDKGVPAVMFETMTKISPPKDPTDSWELCSNNQARKLNAQLKAQGFTMRVDPSLSDFGVSRSPSGVVFAMIHLMGCSHDTPMNVYGRGPFQLTASNEDGLLGPYTKPPTDPKVLKALCAVQ